jgi:hypothetical protein
MRSLDMTLSLRAPRIVTAAVAALALALVALIAAPGAHAADAVKVAKLEAELPAGTAEVWFAAEYGDIDANGTTLAIAEGSNRAELAAMSPTTFGTGVIIPTDADRLTAYVASASAATPDVSLTAVDDSGRILRVLSARVSLAANPATDLEGIVGEATPVDVTPVETAPDAPATTGELGVTGGTIAWSVAIAAAILIALGTAFIVRRRQIRDAHTSTEGAAL